jgi:hypothetical protein
MTQVICGVNPSKLSKFVKPVEEIEIQLRANFADCLIEKSKKKKKKNFSTQQQFKPLILIRTRMIEMLIDGLPNHVFRTVWRGKFEMTSAARFGPTLNFPPIPSQLATLFAFTKAQMAANLRF